MNTPQPVQITQILKAISAGDHDAVRQLFPLVYEHLRRMARARMAREPHQTLQPTALVHEVYLRLLEDQAPRWENRRHFYAAAAEAMRRILIENARRRSSLKRGGDQQKITFHDNMIAVNSDPHVLLWMDEALTNLQTQDGTMSEIVKLRCFAGLTVKEIALALGVSPRNVDRQWAAAKAWLYQEITKRQNISHGV